MGIVSLPKHSLVKGIIEIITVIPDLMFLAETNYDDAPSFTMVNIFLKFAPSSVVWVVYDMYICFKWFHPTQVVMHFFTINYAYCTSADWVLVHRWQFLVLYNILFENYYVPMW